MLPLSESEPAGAGYRLQYMELYNWGTFDNRIYSIHPQGQSSLLTGANGSGKTTLIDALLTLLVPERKFRFYNQSSGSEKKTERTEESYVLGQYGSIQEEGRHHSTAMQLRPDKQSTFSILLAHFANQAGQFLTLVQCRWFVNQELRRVYLIAEVPLSIAEDLIPFDPKGLWRRRLCEKYPATETTDPLMFFDSASKYARRMLRVFGMRSPKALTLFNQTVGIKVLGNLTDFIRQHMLEAGSIEEEFTKLKDTYKLLLTAQNAIEKAERQLELLRPVRAHAEALKQLKQIHPLGQDPHEIVNLYFAQRKKSFLQAEILRLEERERELQLQATHLREQLEEQRDLKESLRSAMATDATGQQLVQLEQSTRRLEQEKRRRQEELVRYNLLAKTLDFPENPDQACFKRSHKASQEREKQLEQKRREQEHRIFSIEKEQEATLRQLREKELEIRAMAGQRNNIPGRLSQIRQELADYLEVSPASLPFVGELIQVLHREQDWEGAVEKVLRGFATSLIVPEDLYSRVNAYLNRINIGGRLVYFKVPLHFEPAQKLFAPPKALVNKLEFHPDSPYSAWVKHQIMAQYDYLCADNLGEFETYKKAMTRQGLIKSGARHEKDDREQNFNRSQYVLGWSSQGKIDFYRNQLEALQDMLAAQQREVEKLRQEQDRCAWLLRNLAKFEQYVDYELIHWQAVQREQEKLAQQQLLLETGSNNLQEMRNQAEALIQQIEILENQRDDLLRRQQDIHSLLTDYRAQVADIELTFADEDLDHAALPTRFSAFEQTYAETLEGLNLDNLPRISKSIHDRIEKQLREEHQKREQLERQLERAMLAFKRPDKELLYRFPDWSADTYQLSEDIAYVDDYLQICRRIEEDDLPSYNKEFERYLTTHMIQKMADFRESFYLREQEILQTVRDLNDSLEKINFRNNPETFIQLKTQRNPAPHVQRFKEMLESWVPGSTPGGDEIAQLRQSFDAIRQLIERLDAEEHWKNYVTDVRNWNEYYAEEFYRETGRQMKVYRSMGELSGGEKAQLTYTILGSAIAYQFGITQNEPGHSFRFIAVDESFSNQDDEKATYLMDLCRQLDLQLLVVTPNDKTHIVEPYISSVHFVFRKPDQSSMLLDMPIVQFREKRSEWQKLSAASLEVAAS